MERVLELQLPSSLSPADVGRLCAALHSGLLDGEVTQVVCRAERVRVDVATVEALARLSLTARRAGARLGVRGSSGELISLLHLVGLDELLDGPGAERDE